MENNIVSNQIHQLAHYKEDEKLSKYGSKSKANTNSTYNKTFKINLTGEGYFTYDDKESSNDFIFL